MEDAAVAVVLHLNRGVQSDVDLEGSLTALGVGPARDETVVRWSSSPIRRRSDVSSCTSSRASRHAVSQSVSPGSCAPPGKLTSPLWVRMF